MEREQKIKLAEKIQEFEKKIKKELEPYVATTQKYQIKVNKKYGKCDCYIDIICYGDNVSVRIKKYIDYNNVFVPVVEFINYQNIYIPNNAEECLDILADKEHIWAEISEIKEKEQMLQAEKNELLNKILNEKVGV